MLLSDLEHNAVLRPLNALARTRGISYDVYPTGAGSGPPSAERILYEIKKRIRKNTRMVLAIHASNVASVQLPIEAIGRFCRRRELFFVVDAAQSAGHVPISMKRACVDALCVPGHKGLLGPQGCGALLLSERISPESLLEGGSGVYSFDPEMPRELPERLEAGTLPTPAIAGLYAGICKLRALGMERIAVEERVLQQRLKKRLLAIPRMHVLAPYGIGSVLSFYVDGCPSETLGHALDQRGICVRAGFHCAPLAHQTLRSAQEGAVRVSIGYSNTVAEIDTLADALEEILKG